MPRYPRVGISKLSELEIDVSKDWAAKKIENLGAPDTGDDAPRNDTIDSKITTHKADASAHHAKTTSLGDITDHNLAAHGLGTVVPHDSLASLTERAHGSLTGVTSDQHHTKTTSFADLTDRAGATKLNWGLNKLLKGAGAGADPTEIDVPVDSVAGTVSLFQANAATGTMDNPGRINDGDTATIALADAVGEYAEVDLGFTVKLQQWRHYGSTLNNGDGTWKIQYWDGSAWQDWVTGILTRTLASWSDFITETVITTTKIRLVATQIDTAGSNRITQLEIIL